MNALGGYQHAPKVKTNSQKIGYRKRGTKDLRPTGMPGTWRRPGSGGNAGLMTMALMFFLRTAAVLGKHLAGRL
jgi:hypothetical protein